MGMMIMLMAMTMFRGYSNDCIGSCDDDAADAGYDDDDVDVGDDTDNDDRVDAEDDDGDYGDEYDDADDDDNVVGDYACDAVDDDAVNDDSPVAGFGSYVYAYDDDAGDGAD